MSKLGTVPFDGEGRAGLSRADGELLADRYRVENPARRISPGVDTWTGAPVLVKRSEHADREAEVLEAVRHPGVVRLRERLAGELLVLDFVDGIDLGTLLASRQGRLEASRLEDFLSSLTEALEAVHAAGFIHRDLKPANILLRPEGQPVVVDLGTAAPTAPSAPPVDLSLLTDGYAAPEQYLTDWPEGPWTDVYGLGALAYHAATGKPPPPALERLKRDRMEPALEAGAGCPEPLLRAIDRALALDPAERPRTVAEWLSILRAPVPDERAIATAERAIATAEPVPGSHDDDPPTVPVRRVPIGQVRRPAPDPGAMPASPPRRRVVLGLVCLIGVLGLGSLAAFYGRPLYERHLKDEWLVDQAGEGDVASIAEAIARARDGATIKIAPGTYAESLRLDRPLHLRPAAPDAPPLIAPGEGSCVELAGAGASIAGMRLMAPAPPDPPMPCIVASGPGAVIESNRVGSASGPVILVRAGADAVVRGNTIEDAAGPGIVITAGATGEITGNTIARVAGAAVIVSGGAAPTIRDNAIAESGSVLYAEGAGGSFERNRIGASLVSAIQVTSGAMPALADNTIEQPRESGIFVFDQGGGRLTGNRIVGSALSGIIVADGAGVEIQGNTVEKSAEHGVLVIGESTVVLTGNTVADSAGHGIAIAAEAEAELADNALSGNRDPQLLDAREP
jgi:parallel beta-helix repeat protein